MNKRSKKNFKLFLKLKNQTIQNAPKSKKYSMIKEISLQNGDNLIGSDICKCSIYLPFEEMPGQMGKITVKEEDCVKKFFLTDFGKSSTFYLSKMKGKQMIANKEMFLKPHQKVYINNLVEMHVQMLFDEETDSMCFEEENEESVNEKKEEWDLLEQEVDEEKQEEEQKENEKEEENELGKRNGEHLEKEEKKVTLKEIAEDKEILSQVKNPFNSKQGKESAQKMKTPKKRAKKKVKSEEKTTLKIINYFKIIDKKLDDEQTTSKQETVEEKPIESVPQKTLFKKKSENSGSAPDPNKFTKKENFSNLMQPTNDLENNLNFIRHSLQKKEVHKSIEVDEKKLRNRLLNTLLKKADVIQNNPTAKTSEMVDSLKTLSMLKWWICFSNVNQTKKHEELVKTLKKMPNIFVFEDFEKFVNAENKDSQIQKVLIMERYKRTYKLIVAMNKNILPLDYKWAEDVAKNKNIFSNPCDHFIEYPKDQKIFPGYNKFNVVGWFKLHSHKFKINLKQSYLMRKQSTFGFLENHNVIIYDKCFRGIRLENLNINRNGTNMPSKKKPRGIRSSQKENDNGYIMRRIVETADGSVKIIGSLKDFDQAVKPFVVNVLVVDNFKHQELDQILKSKQAKVFSKESFLNSFLKQYLHMNEEFKCQKKAVTSI